MTRLLGAHGEQFSPQLDNEIVLFRPKTRLGAEGAHVCVCVCLLHMLQVCASANLYRLRVVEMVTQVHQDLRHPVRDVVRA